MTTEPPAESAHTQPDQHEPASGEPGEAGEAPRKRRRRRGGRNRKRRDAQPEDASSEATPQAGAGTQSDQPESRDGAGPRDGRGPRGRGRGRGGRDSRDADRGRNDARRDAGRYDDDVDEEPTPRKRERRKPEVDREHWEEIFEGRTFAELGLRNSVLKGIEAAGFTNPTKIQSELIPLVLAGKDVLGQSRTGTGKTAAFGLPLFHLAIRELPFQSLILAPTRELAIQIADELTELGQFTPIKVSAVFGGQHVGLQARNLDRGPEIIVATPGRLMDMVQRGHIHLNNIRFAILDEVDRMLDIGFRDDIKKILGGIRSEHQTVFVSATISEEIEKLARTFMKRDAEKLVTTGGSLTVSLVDQHYIPVAPWDKRRLLLHVLTHEEPDLTVVFCRMKRTVDDVAKYLREKGVDAHAIHGDMYQGKRNSVMRRLRAGELGVLIASDLAARGLDVDDISHVINYDLPEDPEVYIHRIGRTARAGRRGVAWSLVTPEQGPLLTEIEKLANTHIPEKSYPDFTPGQLPASVAAERARDTQRLEQAKGLNRLQAQPTIPPVAKTADPSRFPGGLVPTKLPPKQMGGRVRTSRSMRQAMTPPPAPPAPDA